MVTCLNDGNGIGGREGGESGELDAEGGGRGGGGGVRVEWSKCVEI